MTELDSKLRVDFQKIGKPARYGTAGFRDLATHMPYISFRVGVFVAILNKTQPSKTLGVVMSASHNKIQDNGVKITNFLGNMLERSYEIVLEKFVNEKDLEKAVKEFKQYLVKEGKVVCQCHVNVMIGGDTRPSTPQLLELVAQGVQYAGGKVVDFKLTTTPQLQYYVYLYNTTFIKSKQVENGGKEEEGVIIDPEELRELYWKNFSSYYRNCITYLNLHQPKHRTLDCANGIGGKIIPHFIHQLSDLLHLQLINNTHPQLLNNHCGADFIKVDKHFPTEYTPRNHNCFISFDGDADRIVEFVQINNQLALIDGDRQGTIFTTFYKRISQQLKQRTLMINNQLQNGGRLINAPCNPMIGFVQTFYANYASSEYLLQNYKMEPIYAATGVKFLHEKAEHFDIGVYFEANGHGTVIFSDEFLHQLQALLETKDEFINNTNNHQLHQSLQQYFAFVHFYHNACLLANPSVGDAICNLLIFELALSYLKLGYKDTLDLYTDLKSKTSKIAVKSKENVRTTDIEDKVVEPQGLQQQIDEIVNKHDGKKAFLRPSGTQNVLRLHVEAKTMDQVEAITREINQIVSVHPELN